MIKLIKQGKEIEDAKVVFQKEVKYMVWIIVPLAIMAIVFSFAKWLPIFSFGMIIFWGILVSIIYHAIITRVLWENIKK